MHLTKQAYSPTQNHILTHHKQASKGIAIAIPTPVLLLDVSAAVKFVAVVWSLH